MAKIIIIDSSFLIELFNIPVDSSEEKHASAVELFADAIKNSYDIFCPLSVLYEVANHIVDIKNPVAQIEIATKFKETIISAYSDETPFAIVPNSQNPGVFKELSSLPELCHEYKINIRQGLGLTDCTIIDVAKIIKQNYASRQRKWEAHIWTLHGALKALEPDTFVHEYF